MKKLLLIGLFLNITHILARDVYEINQEIEQTNAELEHITSDFHSLSRYSDEALLPLYEYIEEHELEIQNGNIPDINVATTFIEEYMNRKTNKFRTRSMQLTNRLIDLEAEKRILRK